MLKFVFVLLLLLGGFSVFAQEKIVNLNPDPNGEPWWAGGSTDEPDYPQFPFAKSNLKSVVILPSKIDNSKFKFMRPVFNQAYGSCSQASAIGYGFNYEINCARNTDASNASNRVSPQYTYNFLSDGLGGGTYQSDGLDIIRDNGAPDEKTFGGFNPYLKTGWLSGYDIYLNGMNNRVKSYYNINIDTPEGILNLKRWLLNHADDNQIYGGIAFYYANVTGMVLKTIPSGKYEAGEKIISTYGETGGHGMTIVGYDDSISYDYNNDGRITNDIDITGDGIVDLRDWEQGAWRMVNSWGTSWGVKGYAYLPYALCASKTNLGFSRFGVNKKVTVTTVIPYTKPRLTIKVAVNVAARNKVNFKVGIAKGSNATSPTSVVQMIIPQKKGGAFSMIEGNTNIREPYIEMGFDISSLEKYIVDNEPYTFFFQVVPTASNSGTVKSVSLMSYQVNPEGDEFPASISNVAFSGTAVKTIPIKFIPYSLPEPINVSLNPSGNGYLLKWNKPLNTSFSIYGYEVSRRGSVVDTLLATEALQYNDIANPQPGDAYTISTIYSINGFSTKGIASKPLAIPISASGLAYRSSSIDSVLIPDFVALPDTALTVEFWIKPSNVSGYSQSIGSKWGEFRFEANESGGVSVGIRNDPSYKITMPNGFLNANQWQHIAYTYSKGFSVLYKNGDSVSSVKGSAIYTSGFSSFSLTGDSLAAAPGFIDEIRVWKESRSIDQIKSMMTSEIDNCSAYNTLMLYLNFNQNTGNYITDFTGNYISNTLEILPDAPCFVPSDAFSSAITTKPIAGFRSEKSTVKQFEQVHLVDLSRNNPQAYTWTFAGLIDSISNSKSPVVSYSTPGVYNVSLKVGNAAGNDSITVDNCITVVAGDTLKAEFSSNTTTIIAGSSVRFFDLTKQNVTSRIWNFEGASIDTSEDKTVVVKYENAGVFPVSLKVKNGGEESLVRKENYITVSKIAPVASFTLDNDALTGGGTVCITNNSKYNPDVVRWELPGATTETSTQFAPCVEYAKAGLYPIKLVVSNEIGKDSMIRYISVTATDAHNALYFDATNDYAQVPAVFPATTTEFTLEFWINPSSAKTWNQYIGPGWGYFLFHFNADLSAKAGITSLNSVATPPNTIVLDQWQHFALVYGKSKVQFYRNGILIGTSPAPASVQNIPSFQIGRNATSTIDGELDEFRIWKKARTQKQIISLINSEIQNPTAEPDLLLYYNFNQSGDGFIADAIASKNATRYGYDVVGDAWVQSEAFNCAVANCKPSPTIFSTDTVFDTHNMYVFYVDSTAFGDATFKWYNENNNTSATTQNFVTKFLNTGACPVKLVISNGFATDTIVRVVNVGDRVGVTQISSNFSTYKVSSENGNIDVAVLSRNNTSSITCEVYNILGQPISKCVLTANALKVEGLKRGVYFVRFSEIQKPDKVLKVLVE